MLGQDASRAGSDSKPVQLSPGSSLGSALPELHGPEFGPNPPSLPPDPTFSQEGDKPLLPIAVDDPTGRVRMKLVRNTLAARRSRERKAQRLEELEEKIAELEQERGKWENVAAKREAELL
ncbi:hypothetical protein EKO27_g10762 [Xylaria grammica]|uniref:BZIP domain-containing protein n=1 Tax=Xylaria grammica TaxID=363999 RepID=A0A439CQB5_9PEZI|nr:hypothetical protein EKO27_g10762 [Xylaria grammica]